MTFESANEQSCIRMVLKSAFSELEKAVDQAQSFFSSQIEDEEFLYKILLLVSEAVTNAMEHGNGLDAKKDVKIELLCNAETFEVWVEDEGQGFDPKKLADPLSDEHLMDDGGRGIFLIEQLSDEVRYDLGGRRIGILFHRS